MDYLKSRIIDAEIAIIGAGPAGLAAAEAANIADPSARIVVLDSGRTLEKRHCNVDHQGSCAGCDGQCNVISGFGGCIHNGDGVKLSAFPSGKRLQTLLGDELGDSLMKRALRFILGDLPVELELPRTEGQTIPIKAYPLRVFSGRTVSNCLEQISSRLLNNQRISFYFRAEVIAVKPQIGGRAIVLEWVNNLTRRKHILNAKRIIVATGRQGFLWWRKELRGLQIEHSHGIPSVGFRFEMPKNRLQAPGLLHPDFKTTLNIDGYRFKTFCFCGGVGGGRIKYTNFGPFTLLDGHILTSEDQQTESSNFAIVTQLRNPNGFAWTWKQLEHALLLTYTNLVPARQARPILQWYPDFKAGHQSCHSVKEFADRTKFRPSVTDVGFGDLSTLIDSSMHQAFCKAFETLCSYFNVLQSKQNLPLIKPEDVGVYGLELEGLWDEVIVNHEMKTSIDEIYVAGDAAGIAQGILQAVVSGLRAGECAALSITKEPEKYLSRAISTEVTKEQTLSEAELFNIDNFASPTDLFEQ